MLKLPIQVTVQKLISSRYPSGIRPLSWDERVPGLDVVQLVDGSRVTLASDGQQSPPQSGWVLILRSGDSESGYGWTLYGLPKGSNLPFQAGM